MKPETKFRQNKVLPFLKTLRNTFYEAIQQTAINGSPDYVLCVRGTFVALELKKDQEEAPRKLQQYKLEQVVRKGGIAIVAFPENWDEVKAQILKLDQGEDHNQ